jgi:hypothetical protein
MRSFSNIGSVVLCICLLFGIAFHGFKSSYATPDTYAYKWLVEGHQDMTTAESECRAELTGHESSCNSSIPGIAALDYTSSEWHEVSRLFANKPLYVWVAKFLVKAVHVNSIRAFRLIGGVSLFGIGIAVWLLLRMAWSVPAASLGSMLIVMVGPIVHLAQSLTPDAMACCLQMFAIYWTLRRNAWLSAILFVLAVLARPDDILLAVMLGLTTVTRSHAAVRIKVTAVALILSGAELLNFTINHVIHSLPWSTLYRATFIADFAPMHLLVSGLTARQYLHGEFVIGANSFFQYMPLILLLGALAALRLRRGSSLLDLLGVMAALTVLRFLLFPSMEERFYTPTLLVVLVTLVIAVADNLPSRLQLLRVEG